MYESDDDWEEKAPAPKRRKSTTTTASFPKCSLPPSPPSPPLKDPSPEVPPKKYVKPWTKVIGTAVFEIYDYGNNNTNNNNNNNITKLDVYNNNNSDKDGSDNVKVNEQGHLATSEDLRNDISKSSSFSPVENNDRLVVNNGNVSLSSNTLEERKRSCLSDDDNEAADSDFSRSKTANTSSSSAPPRLVAGSIDTSAASFLERSDYQNREDEASAATTSGKRQHRDSEPQQQHQHGHHQNLQPPPTPQSPQSPQSLSLPQQQPPPTLKPASQRCNYCAVLNSTCERCASHDNARKGDTCHKISPIKLSLSTESNGWYISPDNKDVVKETTCKDSIGCNSTEGAIRGQELGSLPLSPASMTSEGEEENKSPSLLAGSRNLTLEVPSPNQDTKGWYQSSCGSGGVSPSEDRWWRVPA